MTGRGVGSGRGGAATRGGRQPGRRSGRIAAAAEEARGASIQAVFGHPEVLQLILDYAVHDENEEKRLKTLRSVRLVNKDWLTGVTNVMRKNKEALFKLTLTKDNSLDGAPFVAAQGKLLDEFVAAMKKRIEEPLPTFKLKILKEFFRRENYDSFVTCLRQCAEGLLELEMIVPENGGSLPGMLPPVDLPMMQKLVATFKHDKLALTGNERAFAESTNVISLTQTLLSGARSLKKFCVPVFGPKSRAFRAPSSIEFLSFPESITNLELRCKMTSENLELLTRNKLPNLLTLRLTLHNVSFAEELISKIMNNFCEHLQKLCVNCVYYNGPPRHANFVRFPVMTKLRSLKLRNYGLELEEGHPPLLDSFPKVESLRLYNQTPEMLRKWTMSTPLNSVVKLEVKLIDENKSGRNYKNTLPFSLESMQLVHLTFPNITKLYLKLSSGQQEYGLKYLFTKMRQLKTLHITVDKSDSILNSDYWDSVFIGVPVPVITALRENDYWENVELKSKDGVPTIKMLKALENLSLTAVVEPASGQAVPTPIISNLTFTFALMKMNKLKNLRFYGRFQASNEMTTKWKNMGRCMTYSSK